MPKSIELRILERQLELAALELARLETSVTPTLHETEGSDYLTHNSSKSVYYMTVRCDLENSIMETDYGRVGSIVEARLVAEVNGFKGVLFRKFRKGER